MLIVQLLSLSLAGILILLIYIGILFLKSIRKNFGKIPFLVFLIINPILLILIISNLPGLKTQFETSKKFMIEYVKDPISFIEEDQTYIQGDETRLIMWTVAAIEFANHPMGVGTGNVDDRLKKRLLKYGQFEIASHNYNPHNQYLQIAVEIGLFGLLFFIGIILYAFYLGFQLKNMLIVFIGLNLAFNSCFESMLQRQSGIVFFTFWLCLSTVILLNIKSKKEKS